MLETITGRHVLVYYDTCHSMDVAELWSTYEDTHFFDWLPEWQERVRSCLT